MNNTILILVAASVALLLLLGIVWVLMGKKATQPGWKHSVQTRVIAISKGIDSANHASLKFAVLELDKLADFVLKQHNLRGQSMGERMKAAESLFPSRSMYQQFWELHKVRNQLAHEIDSHYENEALLQVCIDYRKLIEALLS